jgi:hypothetical protein
MIAPDPNGTVMSRVHKDQQPQFRKSGGRNILWYIAEIRRYIDGGFDKPIALGI